MKKSEAAFCVAMLACYLLIPLTAFAVGRTLLNLSVVEALVLAVVSFVAGTVVDLDSLILLGVLKCCGLKGDDREEQLPSRRTGLPSEHEDE